MGQFIIFLPKFRNQFKLKARVEEDQEEVHQTVITKTAVLHWVHFLSLNIEYMAAGRVKQKPVQTHPNHLCPEHRNNRFEKIPDFDLQNFHL